jgi:hypothetical protein
MYLFYAEQSVSTIKKSNLVYTGFIWSRLRMSHAFLELTAPFQCKLILLKMGNGASIPDYTAFRV